MLLYKNPIHEEILITIDKSFYQDNINELISDDDTLKFCIEVSVTTQLPFILSFLTTLVFQPELVLDSWINKAFNLFVK